MINAAVNMSNGCYITERHTNLNNHDNFTKHIKIKSQQQIKSNLLAAMGSGVPLRPITL